MKNLHAAWRHVRRSAGRSFNAEIRAEADIFEVNSESHLRRIQTELKKKTYKFSASHGIVKDKASREAKGKKGRPIVIAAIRDRVVQRAVQQILQPATVSFESQKKQYVSDPRLGDINNVNQFKFSPGGLVAPLGGVRPALQLAIDAMNGDRGYYFKSDISSFFVDIDVPKVLAVVRQSIDDPDFIDFFEQALIVRLSNQAELGIDAELFPHDGTGVAQGSSLSTLAGNILLHELDKKLNSGALVSIRYVDDLIFFGSNKTEIKNASLMAQKEMSALGLKMYLPNDGSGKSSTGKCQNGFEFLGCDVKPNSIAPAKKTIDAKLAAIDDRLSKAKARINRALRTGEAVPKDSSLSEVTRSIGLSVYGWEKSLSFCTDGTRMEQMDLQLQEKISNFAFPILRQGSKVAPHIFASVLGIPDTYGLWLADTDKRILTNPSSTSHQTDSGSNSQTHPR